MGRHSAPDDDDAAGAASGIAAAVAAPPAPAPRPRPGRHARPDDVPAGDRSTDTIERIADPVLDEPLPVAETTVIETVRGSDGLFADLLDAPAADAETLPAAATETAAPSKPAKSPKPAKPPKPVKRPEPHVSDRALLRADSAVRARVIAAVVAPFVLYVVVLLALDALDVRTALIWIWVPLITAGVVAGLILDLAHRAAAQKAP